mgnify:CR=1 FL=1
MKLRQTNIAKLSEGVFDVLILGGGINGAVARNLQTFQDCLDGHWTAEMQDQRRGEAVLAVAVVGFCSVGIV